MTKKLVENLIHKELSYKIHGAAIEVRKSLGPGHKEKLYQQALVEELKLIGLAFEREKAIKIYSPKSGAYLGLYRPDFVVEKKVIVEIKAEKFVSQGEIKRIYDYLRNSEYELAYLINFASSTLFVKSVIYTNDRKPFAKLLKKANEFLVAIGLILVLFGGLHTAHAASSASIYFGSADSPIVAGHEFSIPVLVSSDQPLNAYSISMSYDPKTLEPKRFDRSRSIIDVSQNEPEISTVGVIRFKGGSISSFKGIDGELFTVRFKALQAGPLELSFGSTFFYLANGKGTKIFPQSIAAHFFAKPSTSTAPEPSRAPHPDSVPAKIRFLSFVNDPLNPDQKFLSFSVQDAGRGIQKILYQSRSLLSWGALQPAINPVVLSKNVWSASLVIIDNEGRSIKTTIYDWPALLYSPLSAFVLLFLAITIAAVSAVRKRKRV